MQINGIRFGQSLKKWRIEAGIKSRDLSLKIGKALTYVSQLERGLIKKVDEEICYKLLIEVGFDEKRIQDNMLWFNVVPNIDEHEPDDEYVRRKLEEEERLLNDDSYHEHLLEQQMYFESMRLKDTSDMIYRSLNVLIDRDLSKAGTVLENMEWLTTDKERFDFFCSLFLHDYSVLRDEQRNELLQLIGQFFTDAKNKNQEDKA